MFTVLALSVELQSTEKSYTFSFKDTSLGPIKPILLDMLPTQNWAGRLTFPSLALNLNISFLEQISNYYHYFNIKTSNIL